VVEWFEYAVYGFVAVYIGAHFFPNNDSTTQLLATFGIFGLTFFVRPLGAVIFGPMADRIGRKRVLVIALTLMSASTVCVGLLPDYGTLGILAPLALLLLRSLQNLSAGGELGGVAAFVVEYSGKDRRGIGSSWLMFSAIAGFIAGSLLTAGLTWGLGNETMASWGWRIPFVLAGPLGMFGLYIRLKLEDSPEFLALEANDNVAAAPLRESLGYRREFFTTLGLTALHSSSFYIVLSFMVSYLTVTKGFPRSVALTAATVGALSALVVLPIFGKVSDRVGRKPILVGASATIGLTAIPLFLLIGSSPTGAIVGQALLGAMMGALVSTTLVSITEIWPARIRATGSSFPYAISVAAFGGTAPFIATFLIDRTGNPISPAYYLVGTALITFVTSLSYRQAKDPAVDVARAETSPSPDGLPALAITSQGR
jgi:MFS transporter, MHS family, proline/betaine transporter